MRSSACSTFCPLNPDKLGAVAPDLAWNTAVSFTTNTNWQAYVGETTMSHLTQMVGLAFHNFASAAVGIAVAIAVIRGIARQKSATLGNFWVDLVRATLWLLLPLSLVSAIVLMSQGVVQNFSASAEVRTLEGATQKIAQGPVASQEAIKELGTNGGGFFNANSAHPYENPTPFSNLFQMFIILWIAAGLAYTLGSMTGKPRHGWAVFAAMSILFLAMTAVAVWAETAGNPIHHALGVDRAMGNMEGKEVRFGAVDSALFASVTTAASCGAVNAMHDSFTPLGGFVPLVNIMLGEVIYGGVGAGLYGMFVFIVLAVFIAGLMVGRTPEYLGKKIEAKDVKLAMLTVLIFAAFILVGIRGRGGDEERHIESQQRRPARAFGADVRVHQRHRQQRQCVRRPQCEYEVLQRRPRTGDVLRPLLHDHPDHGHRRLARSEEARRGVRRHVPRRRADVHDSARRRDRHRRSADLVPGALTRTARRAFPDARREGSSDE